MRARSPLALAALAASPLPGARPVAQPRLAARRPHRHRRLQPHHRRRRRARPGLRQPRRPRCSSGIRSSTSGRAPTIRPIRRCSPRVFGALVDPLDNSLWLARPDGWIHFQPELQLWDQGVVPDGVQTIAFDAQRSRRRASSSGPAGLAAAAARRPGRDARRARPARPVAPARVDDVLRSNPTLQANAAQILVDPRLGVARYTAAARSFDNLGWYLGTSGVGPAVPAGRRGASRAAAVRAAARRWSGRVFGWPDGVWAATDRTAQADAGAHLRRARAQASSGPCRARRRSGLPFTPGAEAGGAGVGALGRDRPRARPRSRPRDGRVDLLDETRGLPDSRVYAVVSRQGRITVGTAPRPRAGERLAPGRAARAPVRRSGARGLPGRRLGLGRHPARTAAGAARASRTSCGPPRWPRRRCRRRSWRSPRWPTRSWRSPATSCSGAIPRTGAWTLGPNLSGAARRARGVRRRRAGLLGRRRSGRRLRPAHHAADASAPGRATCRAPATTSRWTTTTSGSRTDAGLVRFRLDAIRP